MMPLKIIFTIVLIMSSHLAASLLAAENQVETLSDKIKYHADSYENYELKVMRGERRDYYLRQGNFYFHSFSQKNKTDHETLVDFSREEIYEFSGSEARRSFLKKESYNRLAVGSVDYRPGTYLKESIIERNGLFEIKLTFEDGTSKEFFVDPQNFIVVKRNDYNKKGKLTFKVERELVTFNPNYPMTFFTSFIEKSLASQRNKNQEKKLNAILQSVSNVLGTLVGLLILFVMFVKRRRIVGKIKKSVIFLSSIGINFLGIYSLFYFTRGFLSMIMGAITWKALGWLPKFHYDYIASFIQAFFLVILTVLPFYLILGVFYKKTVK